MSRATLLEVRGRTAGLVVGAATGFRFFSAQPAFDAFDGREFPSLVAAERAISAPADRKPTSSPTFRRSL
jgi:hypothetical protein